MSSQERITALCAYANGAWHALEDDAPEVVALVSVAEKAEALAEVAYERELREHGPGCRCSLAVALAAFGSGEGDTT